MKIIELPATQESGKYYDLLEKRIKVFFRKYYYYPLLEQLGLPKKIVKNAAPTPLEDALFSGKVFYSQGAFRGSFNAGISKELRDLGAKFDRKSSSFKIPLSQVSPQLKNLISASLTNFKRKMDEIDQKLSKIIPEEIAANFHAEDIFDQALYKTDQDFKKDVKKITVTPDITPDQRKKIASEWQENTRLNIAGWTEQQIKELRKNIYEDVLAGSRKESFVSPILKVTQTIQKDYDKAISKAKFIAHQETRILMSTFKQARYEEAGSRSYIWRCVHRPHDATPKMHIPGNVRYSHGLLDGKEFEWSSPPITSNPGEPTRRNNPGTDFNCRCFARPLIRVRK